MYLRVHEAHSFLRRYGQIWRWAIDPRCLTQVPIARVEKRDDAGGVPV
jgi:hypothetical protein